MTHSLLILGMHRSGTSSVAGVLHLLGATTPKNLMPATEANQRGYYESLPLSHFHEELLASAGSTWHDWRAFNPSWFKAPGYDSFKQRARDLFKSEFDSAPLPVLKDPRICRFLPFWRDVLTEIGLAPHVVMPVRSPLEVAQSLRRRDHFPITKGLLIWLRHVLDAEFSTRDLPRAIFGWDEFLADWRLVADRITGETGISFPRLSDRSAREIDDFLSHDLKHHAVKDAELFAHPDVHEWARAAYEALLILAREPNSNSARTRLDEVRQAFDRACDVFGRVVLDHELALETAQAEAGRAAGEAAQRTAEIGEIERQRDAVAADLAARTQEIATLNAALAEQQHHAQEIADALAAERARSQEIADALALTRAEKEALAAALDQAQADKQSLTDALAQVSADKQEIATAVAAIRAERDEIHHVLAQRTQELETSLATQADLIRQRDQIHEALTEARAGFANELARQTSEAIEARDGLFRATQEKEQIAAERDGACAETQALSQRIEELQGLLAHQKNVNEQHAREREKINNDLRARLIDAEAESAHKARAGSLRGIASLGQRPRQVAWRIQNSPLFDANFYRMMYPESAMSGLDPAEHYVREGFCRGRFPHPLFDTRYYLAENEDVRRSGVNPLLHYVLHGAREGRKPNAYFDPAFYLAAYPDVAAQNIDPLVHYMTIGAGEGRDPSPAFNTKFYLATYPDVVTSGLNPLAHFLHYGLREGRLAVPAGA